MARGPGLIYLLRLMKTLDNWINREAIGFYTDEKGRKRPITRRVGKNRIEGGIYSDDELLEYIRSLVHIYCEELGIENIPEIAVPKNKWKKAIAKVRTEFSRDGKLIKDPVIYVNLPLIKKLYKINPEYADKILRFSIAHEVGHLKQVYEYGVKMATYPKFILEYEADETARELSGLDKSEIEVLEERLSGEKTSRRRTILDEVDIRGKSKLYTFDGKIVARVVGYVSGRSGKYIIPSRSITSVNMIPKSAESIELVVFDKEGYPIITKKPLLVSREELEKYFVLTP